MPPPFPHTVTVHTPGAGTTDPGTNNPIPGAPVNVTTPALMQATASRSSGDKETASAVISDWLGVFPLGTVINSKSTVTDQHGRLFQVVGSPAVQESLLTGPSHVEAELKFLSDIQGV